MEKLIICVLVMILSIFLTNCNEQVPYNQKDEKANVDTEKRKIILNHCVYSNDISKLCECPFQIDLKDSLLLLHIKGSFYRSKTGHLYKRTVGQIEINSILTDTEYFNGYFSQEVDPLSFEVLGGWYAKDKKYVYYFRPVSGGMQISKIDTADAKTFKILAGHYKYGKDMRFFYNETQIIDGFIPNKTHLKFDSKGRVSEMMSSNKTYKFERVN